MNRDDIIRMARGAGLESIIDICDDGSRIVGVPDFDKLERFANLVAAAEREECAKVCEETTAAWTEHLYNEGSMDCAAAIRARGQG